MPDHPLSTPADLDTLNERLAPLSFRAGWNKAEPSLWAEPRTRFVPAHWRWQDARAGLDTAGRLIDTELAERRNLFMVNPHPGNHYATLRTLVCAYQMILPGERARSHRHSPHALRFVLDVGAGSYTVVDGARIDMQPGDVLLTPGWGWHGHGNDGDRPGYWVDFLDVPTVHLLEPMFLEHWPAQYQAPEQTTRAHPYVFPWADTERLLAAAAPDPSGRHGRRVRLDSDAAIPTMALSMQRLPAGFAGRAWRTTANQIVCVKSGSGTAQVGERSFEWQPGDVFVVPSWHRYQLNARAEADLFVVSDEALQRKLHYLREEPTP
ncbi:gentisate 1,2-dioxygenase [Pigmentiphaga soli]|uniref:Gentisate 1,2-dioxygenase n=1 Tax=Pigmentiphaga soli TaxID=1007095 RepID=A0ABP8HQ21_9BURK